MPLVPPPSPRVLAVRRAIGERIRDARLHANMSQEMLGERASVDRQAINRIELGHQSPILDTLIRIADVLDIPLRDLV